MTQPSKLIGHHTKAFQLPTLNDEAVIQIQDFLHLTLDLFEDHYARQIERFYRSIAQDCSELDLGESPH